MYVRVCFYVKILSQIFQHVHVVLKVKYVMANSYK